MKISLRTEPDSLIVKKIDIGIEEIIVIYDDRLRAAGYVFLI